MFNYLRKVQIEMKHVVWPSQRITWIYTGFVIVLTFAVGYFIGLFDFIFTLLLGFIV
jgi:preprotein translocase SecE subunit